MVPTAVPGLVRNASLHRRSGRSWLCRQSALAWDVGTSLARPKSKDLGVAAPGHENIRGFDVAMDDAFGVGGVERVRDFDGELQEKVGLERLAGRCGASGSGRPDIP